MPASTLRFVIIVALLVGGALVIDQAFSPTAVSGAGGGNPGGSPVSPSADGSPSQTQSPPVNIPSPTVVGTRVAVFNGTGISGLAGDTMAQLLDLGYVEGQEVADAPTDVSVTTLYYRTKTDKVEAEYLANEFFGQLSDVKIARLRSGQSVEPQVQVAIFLGNDYAAAIG